MAAELKSDLVPIGQAQPSTVAAYDLIGSGSGIYGGKLHETLIKFAETLPTVTENGPYALYQCLKNRVSCF